MSKSQTYKRLDYDGKKFYKKFHELKSRIRGLKKSETPSLRIICGTPVPENILNRVVNRLKAEQSEQDYIFISIDDFGIDADSETLLAETNRKKRELLKFALEEGKSVIVYSPSAVTLDEIIDVHQRPLQIRPEIQSQNYEVGLDVLALGIDDCFLSALEDRESQIKCGRTTNLTRDISKSAINSTTNSVLGYLGLLLNRTQLHRPAAKTSLAERKSEVAEVRRVIPPVQIRVFDTGKEHEDISVVYDSHSEENYGMTPVRAFYGTQGAEATRNAENIEHRYENLFGILKKRGTAVKEVIERVKAANELKLDEIEYATGNYNPEEAWKEWIKQKRGTKMTRARDNR